MWIAPSIGYQSVPCVKGKGKEEGKEKGERKRRKGTEKGKKERERRKEKGTGKGEGEGEKRKEKGKEKGERRKEKGKGKGKGEEGQFRYSKFFPLNHVIYSSLCAFFASQSDLRHLQSWLVYACACI